MGSVKPDLIPTFFADDPWNQEVDKVWCMQQLQGGRTGLPDTKIEDEHESETSPARNILFMCQHYYILMLIIRFEFALSVVDIFVP